MSRAPLFLCAALALSACSAEDHSSHHGPEFHFGAAPERPDAPTRRVVTDNADGSAAPGVRPDGSIVSAVEWFEGSLEQALAAAKAESPDTLVFVDVGAYWCPPCHELDEKTFVDSKVGQWLDARTIPLHIDAEKGEGPELVERYNVQAYPTLLVLEQSGMEKGRVVDFIEPAALVTKLDTLASGGNVLDDLEAAVEKNPDDLQARYDLGHAYLLAARVGEAQSQYAKVLQGDIDNDKGYAAKIIYDHALFSTLKIDDDPEKAILEWKALQDKFPESKEATRAYRMIARVHCQQGRPDEAVASLDAMLATDPEDPELKSTYGWLSFRQDCRPDAGLKAVLAGIEQDPESADLRYLEAELRRLVDQLPLALTAIAKASELEPDSAYYKRQVRRFEELASGGASAVETAPGEEPEQPAQPADPAVVEPSPPADDAP